MGQGHHVSHWSEGGPSSCVISGGSWVVHTVVNSIVHYCLTLHDIWRLAGDSCGTSDMVISCVAYSCTNRQSTGSNTSMQ